MESIVVQPLPIADPATPSSTVPPSPVGGAASKPRASPAPPPPRQEVSPSPSRPQRPSVLTHHHSAPASTHSPSLMPPPYAYRTPLLHMPASSPVSGSVESSSALSPSSFASHSHFGLYPGSLPSNMQFLHASSASPPVLTSTHETGASGTGTDLELDMGFDLDFDVLEGADDGRPPAALMFADAAVPMPAVSPSKKRVAHTPRPPNAWILYRSDKLKAIAAGESLPNLDAVLAESGISGGSVSASSGDELGVDRKRGMSSTAPSSQVPSPSEPTAAKVAAKKKKGKKGAKEPTEGMLALGKGKTGRGLPQADISKMISMLWKRESATVRAKYERMSELKKIEASLAAGWIHTGGLTPQHLEKYPGYKFQPLRKADKMKQREERELEKQAAKREKEAQIAATRGQRRSRTRTRASPTSLPYTRTPALTGRCLSYSGGDRDGAPGAGAFAAHHDHGLQDAYDSKGWRSYPFPMPPGSLPSMRPEDHVNNPYADAGSLGLVHDRPRDEQPPYMPPRPPYPSSMPEPSHMSSARQQWLGPPPPGAPLTQAHSYGGGGGGGAVAPGPWATDIQGVGPAFAVPYIFEPIPLPGDKDAAPMTFSAEAAELAATWCLLEEDLESAGAGGADANAMPGPGPSTAAHLATQQGIFKWDADAAAAVEQWHALDAQPDTFGSIGLSSSIAEEIAAGWAAQQPPSDAAPFFPGAIDPSLGFVTVALGNEHASHGMQHGSDTAGGPFLSATQPLSPLDSWTFGTPTPRDGTLRPSGGNVDHRGSLGSAPSPAAETVRAVSSLAPPPRHVSASAYPPTPLSVDPSAMQPLTWGERQPSLSFAGLGTDLLAAADDLTWETPTDDAPRAAADSAGPAPCHAGPPRGARRGRAVAAKFETLD